MRLATKPPVDGARNIKLASAENFSLGYVITYVPVGQNPPYRAEWCNNHFYKRAGSTLEKFEARSHQPLNPSLDFLPLLPEDTLLLLGLDAQDHLYYEMNNEIYLKGGGMFHWRFYASNSPAQHGTIPVGPGSFCNF